MSAYKGQPWSPQYSASLARTVAVTGAVRRTGEFWELPQNPMVLFGPRTRLCLLSYFDLCHLEESLMVEWPCHHDIPCLFRPRHISCIPRASGFQIWVSWNPLLPLGRFGSTTGRSATSWVQEEQGSRWRWLTSAEATISACLNQPWVQKQDQWRGVHPFITSEPWQTSFFAGNHTYYMLHVAYLCITCYIFHLHIISYSYSHAAYTV